jgi:hypothetical protein
MADKKTIPFPRQKTFIFSSNKDASEIDNEINEWSLEKVKEGKGPMLGKCFANHDTGDIYYVFMYLDKVEV